MHELDAVRHSDGETQRWFEGPGTVLLRGRAQVLHPLEALQEEREGEK